MARYHKKSDVVEAVQWLNRKIVCPPGPEWFAQAEEGRRIELAGDTLFVKTPNGVREARPGDWVVMDAAGYLYVRRPDVFAATFDPC